MKLNKLRCNKNIRHVLVWIITRKFCPYFIAKPFINFLWGDDNEKL